MSAGVAGAERRSGGGVENDVCLEAPGSIAGFRRFSGSLESSRKRCIVRIKSGMERAGRDSAAYWLLEAKARFPT